MRQLVSGGLTRRYRLHLPTKATTDTRMPLVLNFHGRYSFSEEEETLSGLVPVSDRETFLLVSPDGTGSPTGWSAGATPRGSVDDVQFVSDLLDRLQQEFCVDLSRVYATGYSNGAFMASKVGCELSERIAAIAPVGGVNSEDSSCPAAVPLIAFHGTADAVVPFAGGRVRGWWYMGARSAMNAWALNNGCSTTTVRSDPAPGFVQQVYLGCFAATVLVISPGAGHHWPETVSIPPLGPTASVSAAELIWTFFSDKQR